MNTALPIEGTHEHAFDLELVSISHADQTETSLELLTRISAAAWHAFLEELPCFINRGAVPEAEAALLERYGAHFGFVLRRHPSAILNQERARRMAADPSLSPALLARLGRSDDRETRRLVARNPNLSKKMLLFLAEEFPADFLENPFLGLLQIEAPDLIEKLAASLMTRLLGLSPLPSLVERAALTHASPAVRATLAGLPSLSHATLEALLRDPAPAVLSALATREDLSRGQQQQLAAQPSAREGLAKNLTTHPLILRKLSNAQEVQVCVALAKNPRISPELQRRLAGHKRELVREALAENQAVSAALLLEFAGSPDERFRGVAARHPNTPAERLAQMAAQEELAVKVQLAKNPSTPSEILRKFATEGPPALSVVALNNPGTPLEALEFVLTSKSKKYKALLAQRRDLTPRFFEALLGEQSSTTFEVRAALAVNPALPEPCMRILAVESRDYIRLHLITNPNLPKEILYEMAQPSGGKGGEYTAIEQIFSGRVPGLTLDKTP